MNSPVPRLVERDGKGAVELPPFPVGVIPFEMFEIEIAGSFVERLQAYVVEHLRVASRGVPTDVTLFVRLGVEGASVITALVTLKLNGEPPFVNDAAEDAIAVQSGTTADLVPMAVNV